MQVRLSTTGRHAVNCGCSHGSAVQGGFGPEWSTAHLLGRAVDCQALKELLLPSLTGLIANLRASHAQHPLLPTVEALDWLREVWLQDLPLKLAKYGDRYRALLPAAVYAVECHPAWPAFRTQVLEQDAATKSWAIANRAFRGNPVAVLQQLQAGSARQAPGLAEQKLEADPPPRTSRAAKQVTQGHVQQA